jgi:hypothetical protein
VAAIDKEARRLPASPRRNRPERKGRGDGKIGSFKAFFHSPGRTLGLGGKKVNSPFSAVKTALCRMKKRSWVFLFAAIAHRGENGG